MSFKKITEQDSLYHNLENLSTVNLINSIHNEDKKICSAIQKDNIFGVQFHPEKSHRFGMSLMKRFVEL